MTNIERKRGVLCFAAGILVLIGGIVIAAVQFPGGFDWQYMVVSRLGSRTHNPVGGMWLSAGLLGCVMLLWPVSRLLQSGEPRRVGAAVLALRTGLLGLGLLAAEGLGILDLSWLGRKGHEVVALLTFLGFYGGIVGLYVQRIRDSWSFLLPASLVLLPLCAVAFTQFALYFDQRDLGWVNTAWRELGVPVWLSFAFWQWLAVGFLGVGLGVLLLPRRPA